MIRIVQGDGTVEREINNKIFFFKKGREGRI